MQSNYFEGSGVKDGLSGERHVVSFLWLSKPCGPRYFQQWIYRTITWATPQSTKSSLQGRNLSLFEVDVVARIVNSNTYGSTKEGIHLFLASLE